MLKNILAKIKDMVKKYNQGKEAHPKIHMTEAEKAWLASAIDGEGSIIHTNRTLLIAVFNTNLDYCKETARLFGTNANISKRESKVKGWKTCYRAVLCGRIAVKEVLQQIMPYLIIKKEHATKLVNWINNNPPQNRVDNIFKFWKKQGKDFGTITVICEYCKQPFRIWKRDFRRGRKYCDRNCYHKGRKKNE